MGYDTLFKLAVSTNVVCTYAYVTDHTAYPYQTKERTELAIALFWSVNSFSSVLGYDITNNDDWYFEVSNGYDYVLHGFLTPIWDSGATYNAGTKTMILYHEGAWYYQSADAPSGEPGAHGTTGWPEIDVGLEDPTAAPALLTIDTLYALFSAALLSGSQDYCYCAVSFETACPDFSIVYRGDHTWRLTDGSAGATIGQIRLIKYDSTVLDTSLTFEGALTLDIDLSTYEDGGDGVYIIEIYDDAKNLLARLPIFDFTDTRACYLIAFKYMICKCQDPCDADCIEREKIDQRRDDLIRIHALYNEIVMQVYVDRYQYMGIMSVDDERSEFINSVAKSVELIKEVVDRCGLCTENESNVIDC